MATDEALPPFAPEQASMFYYDGDDSTMITAFTWSKIEKRLAELSDNKLLMTNDAGQRQEVPCEVKPGKRDKGGEWQLQDVAVIAISCNNHACELDLPCKVA
jgi:hypothetical protein